MTQNREIVKNVHFWPILTYFWPFLAKPEFFSKIGPCHFFCIVILHNHAQNQKDLMTRFLKLLLLTNQPTNIFRPSSTEVENCNVATATGSTSAWDHLPEFSQRKGVHHTIILIIRSFNPQNKRNLMTQNGEIVKNVHFWPILAYFSYVGQ